MTNLISKETLENELYTKVENTLVVNDTKTPLKPKQITHILSRTPKEHIQTRPGKGGGTFKFVSGVYIKKKLNYIFGFNWNFEIKKFDILQDQVLVFGRLTVKIWNEEKKDWDEIVKEQFGRADIKKYKDTHKKAGEPIDIGNDLKAGATDALKKCASELGIAGDVYGENEFRDIVAEIKSEVKGNEMLAEVEKLIEQAETEEQLNAIYMKFKNEKLGKGFYELIQIKRQEIIDENEKES